MRATLNNRILPHPFSFKYKRKDVPSLSHDGQIYSVYNGQHSQGVKRILHISVLWRTTCPLPTIPASIALLCCQPNENLTPIPSDAFRIIHTSLGAGLLMSSAVNSPHGEGSTAAMPPNTRLHRQEEWTKQLHAHTYCCYRIDLN